jgi:hypothetical protein
VNVNRVDHIKILGYSRESKRSECNDGKRQAAHRVIDLERAGPAAKQLPDMYTRIGRECQVHTVPESHMFLR